MTQEVANAERSDIPGVTADTGALPLILDETVDQRKQPDGVADILSRLTEQHAQLGLHIARVVDLVGRPTSIEFNTPGEAPIAVMVRCLGTFEVVVGGVSITTLRSGKARSLLQYLVCHHQHPVPRQQLVEALWPDPEAFAAQSSLRVAVHALRQALRQNLGATSLLRVVATDVGYQLIADGLWLDTEMFEGLCRQAERWTLGGQSELALESCRQAATLYRGDFLSDCWDDWAVFRREALKDQYLGCVGQLADAALTAGEWHTCIGYCRQILEQDHCREDAFRALMLSHARLGQHARVRRWFELCQHTLRTELDTEPEAETIQLYEQLKRTSGLRPSGN
jgi:two-component SAPR family response regulator